MGKEQPVIKIEIHPGRVFGLVRNLPKSRSFRNSFIALFLIALLFGGYEGAFAYRVIKLVKEGDNLFADGKYSESLEIYRKADSAWDKTIIVGKFRVSPTIWRINKASTEIERLAESQELAGEQGQVAGEQNEQGGEKKNSSSTAPEIPSEPPPEATSIVQKIAVTQETLNSLSDEYLALQQEYLDLPEKVRQRVSEFLCDQTCYEAVLAQEEAKLLAEMQQVSAEYDNLQIYLESLYDTLCLSYYHWYPGSCN